MQNLFQMWNCTLGLSNQHNKVIVSPSGITHSIIEYQVEKQVRINLKTSDRNFTWPIRWTRSSAWIISPGVQDNSANITVLAAVKVNPTPPALMESYRMDNIIRFLTFIRKKKNNDNLIHIKAKMTNFQIENRMKGLKKPHTTAAFMASFSWKSVTKVCLDVVGVLPSILMQSTFFFWKQKTINLGI